MCWNMIKHQQSDYEGESWNNHPNSSIYYIYVLYNMCIPHMNSCKLVVETVRWKGGGVAHYAYSWLSHSPPLLPIMQVWFTKGQFFYFLAAEILSPTVPPLSKILYLPLNDLPSMYSVLSCLCTRYFIYTLMTWLKKLFSPK